MPPDFREYQQLSDDELARLAAGPVEARAQAAFELLARRHEAGLRSAALRLAGRNRTIADGAYSVTLSEAWDHRQEWQPGGRSWRTWVAQRLEWRVCDEFDRWVACHTPAKATADPTPPPATPASSRREQEPVTGGMDGFRDPKASSPSELALNREAIQAALEKLASVNRPAMQAFVLRHRYVYTAAEIAVLLNCRKGHVYVLFAIAQDFLRSDLGNV